MPSQRTRTAEPLPPAYSPTSGVSTTTNPPRDPETASIRSSAPSYLSELPDYETALSVPVFNPQSAHSHRRTGSTGYGLPSIGYAPGFFPRPTVRSAFSYEAYETFSWSNVSSNRRQYENVARRRAEMERKGARNSNQDVMFAQFLHTMMTTPDWRPESQDSDGDDTLEDNNALPEDSVQEPIPINTLTVTASAPESMNPNERRATVPQVVTTSLLDPHSAPPPPSTQAVSTSASQLRTQEQQLPLTPLTQIVSAPAVLLPQEDPLLVGVAAAERARSTRLYREEMLRDPNSGLVRDIRAWDFFLAQTAEREEADVRWGSFRERRSRFRFGGGLFGRVMAAV